MGFSQKVISKSHRLVTEYAGRGIMPGLLTRKIKGNFILMYHGVTRSGNTRFNRRHTSVDCFRRQISFLKKYCAVVSLSDFFAEKFIPGKPNFAITFDDGYLNNFIYARPVLEQLRCPATFFITGLNKVNDPILWADLVNIGSVLTSEHITVDGETFKNRNNIYYSASSGMSIYEIIKHRRADYDYKLKVKEAFISRVCLDKFPGINEYWQLMSDTQIAETAKSQFITIGSHGFYHNNLGEVPLQDALNELSLSKSYLEPLTNYSITQLAYPDGSYTPKLVTSAAAAGFTVQLAADVFLFDETNNPALIKKRYGIYSVDSCLNQLFGAIKII